MDEHLILMAAKLKADRRKLERERRTQLEAAAPQPPRIDAASTAAALRARGAFDIGMEGAVMRNVIAIAATLAINLALVFAFQRSAEEALPRGEVTVTELGFDSVPALANAAVGEPARAIW